MTDSPWHVSWKADPRAREVADRHYNRQKVGAAQFVPPGRAVVLTTEDAGALWITSWPFAEYVRHAWPGAWVNSCFRRETGPLASTLITAAVAATRAVFGDPPELGIVSFVDASKVRAKRDPGYCYLMAGWRRVGETKGGLLAYQLLPADMPDPIDPVGYQPALLEAL